MKLFLNNHIYEQKECKYNAIFANAIFANKGLFTNNKLPNKEPYL